MRDNRRNQRQRNTYLLLIGAGVFLLAHKLFGFGTIVAAFFLLIGFHRIRSTGERKGYLLFLIGLLILLSSHFTVIVAVVLISLGLFYMKSRDVHKDPLYLQKRSLLESIRWVREPFVLRSMSVWSLIGEVRMDLSLAIFEEAEVTVVLQGVIGDIDLFVPEDVAVETECSVLFGQVDVASEKEAGVVNKIVWRSPHYATAEHRVKLVLSYVVGDVNVKLL